MTKTKLAGCAAVAEIVDSPEIERLIADLEETRWTGRPGYAIRAMIGVVIAKTEYALPTWTRTLRLIAEHAGLRQVLGCESDDDLPSIDAIYRFSAKLKKFHPLVQECIGHMLPCLRELNPGMGDNIAIDGSDVLAYATAKTLLYKGGPARKRFSDPDASWSRRSAVSARESGKYYGYKLHMAVDTATELPVAWCIDTANSNERDHAIRLLDKAREHGFSAEIAVMDKGYDSAKIHEEFEARDCRPIVPLMNTDKVKQGLHLPHRCRHGEWKFAGADYKRKATKWRCPKLKCPVSHRWVPASRLHTMIPRTSRYWKRLFKRRTSVERAFGRLKHEWGLTPLRVRRMERVQLHADLTIMTQLGSALATARMR